MIERVLIVDDEPLARERVAGLVRLVAPGVEIREAGDGDSAFRLIESRRLEEVILDVRTPGRSGFDVIDDIGPDRMPPTVFATAYAITP